MTAMQLHNVNVALGKNLIGDDSHGMTDLYQYGQKTDKNFKDA
jgi:hypothetical protein